MPYQIFNGVYESFGDVEGSFDFFSADLYMGKAIERIDAAVAGVPPHNTYLFAPVAAALYAEKGKLSVLDFGGGPGITYLALKDILPSTEGLTYHTLDNPQVCALGRSRLKRESALVFHDTMDTLDEQYDLIHFGSMLQYVKDLDGLLAALSAKNAKHILVSDAMVGTGRTFVTQADYYGNKHPFCFYSLSDMQSHFSRVGYSLKMKAPFVPTIRGFVKFYDMSNLPEDCRVNHTLHLLFTRA